MTLAKALALVILGFALGVLGTGFTGELQFEFGQCRFSDRDGTYHNKAYPHHNYLTPRCGEIAYADHFKGSRWGYRIGFFTSGAVEARGNIAPNNDGIYSPNPCSEEHVENCHSVIDGSGRMTGFSISLTRDILQAGHWWTRAEVGALFYRDYFNARFRPVDYSHTALEGTSWNRGPDGYEGANANQSSSIINNPLPRIGVQIGWKRLYASVRYHLPAMHRGGLSVTDHSFFQYTVGMRVPL